MLRKGTGRIVAGLCAVLAISSCVSSQAAQDDGPADTVSDPPVTAPAEPRPTSTTPPPPQPTTTTVPASTTTTTIDPLAPPSWLGTIALPIRDDGHGVAQPTPPELETRIIRTVDLLPPPTGDSFESTVESVPTDVVERSTWTADCPVALDDLRYLTVSFVGFDGDFHTGELIVNARVADDVVDVFRQLHEIGFPIEEMRVRSAADLSAPPTGDGNVTSAFECRAAVGSSSFSQHAYGLAIDVNPFQNPYQRGDLVLPELASSYLDRSFVRPGMILAEDDVVLAFRSIGWSWGGYWNSLDDYHHFSANGR